MPAATVDALVVFGATGDLEKIETFPALVGLATTDPSTKVLST